MESILNGRLKKTRTVQVVSGPVCLVFQSSVSQVEPLKLPNEGSLK